MRSQILLGFLYGMMMLSFVTGFIPSWPSRNGRGRIRENERIPFMTSRSIVPVQSRRTWIQKLVATGPAVAALATSFVSPHQPSLVFPAYATSQMERSTLPEPSSAVLDPTVVTLTKGSRTIHIVGTAHISAVSADLAGRLVQETAPDAVFVELDAARLSRAFQGGIPPSGISVAIQDESGNLRIGVTQKPGLAARLLIKFVTALSNPVMYRKLEMAGISAGKEVSGIKSTTLLTISRSKSCLH